MKMKIINTVLTLCTSAFIFLNACEENIAPVVDELNFNRAFAPVGLSAAISNATTVSLTWSSVKNTDHYVLEIWSGQDFETGTLVQSYEIENDETAFTSLLTGDMPYSARLKAVSSLEGVAESKWSSVNFKTDPENLFKNYVSRMTGLHTCVLKWTPGSEVTALVFDNGTAETPYTVTASEKAAGEKTITGVANAGYKVRLMYNNVVRGKTNILIEGDALLTAGGDLATALNALPAGGVLILANGTGYGLDQAYWVNTSMKIRGLYPDDRPVIYLKTGTSFHIFDIGASVTQSDSLVFDNVDISCYYDDAGVTKHRGVFDQESTACSIGKIRFLNSIIRNSARSAIRLRSGGTPVQYIGTVEFNNCTMYDFAFTDHYGILNGAKGGNFGNIKFINSTVFNIRGGIINYGNGAGCQSVIIDNCTFDRITMDEGTGRYLIDFGTTGNTSAGTITISDCIFGQTRPVSHGVRNNLMSLSVTGSWYTSDFINVNNSIAPLMTAYPGSSSALWIDPLTAWDFHFLDQSFGGRSNAGDPKWKP